VTESSDYKDGPALDDPDAAAECREWRVEALMHGQRLDRVLAQQAPEFSRSHLQSLIERGHVRVDGQVASQNSRKVKVAQHIAVELIPTAQALAFKPELMSLPIVYEDEHVLVINKPAGLVVHPGAGNWTGTLLNGLLAYLPSSALLPRAGIVHRLDKGTTGLMVVAKTLLAVTELVRAIAARDVRREYAAVVHGASTSSAQVFEGSIGRDPQSRLRMAVLGSGKAARTDVQWLDVQSSEFGAVHCRLHTGRTHQIRVHLSHAGHPLVGDTLYGGKSQLGLERPALHAWKLSFQHPVRGATLSFEAPFPDDFARAWHQVVVL
jgi:23S rRNA pseudouridine1911/1915/1917 synthase